MRNWIDLLVENVESNALNLKKDFFIPWPGAKGVTIPSARQDMLETVERVLAPRSLEPSIVQQCARWFSVQFVNWASDRSEHRPFFIRDSVLSYLQGVLDIDEFVLIPEGIEAEDVVKTLPEWAKTADVIFPFEAGGAFDMSAEQDDGVNDCADLFSVLDYLIYCLQNGTRIDRMSVNDALVQSERWHHKTTEDGSAHATEVLRFPDGYKIVRIETVEGLDYESKKCSHCVGRGGYDNALRSGSMQFYSLRDKENHPHVTMAVAGGKILEMQGLANTPPNDEVHAHLLQFMARAHLQMKNTALFKRNFGSDPIVTI